MQKDVAANQAVHDNGALLAAMLKDEERPFRDADASVLVDEIGQYDARIAALNSEREQRADELKARGVRRYVGQFYECNVYRREGYLKLSTDYVKGALARYLKRKHPKVYAKCFEEVEETLCLRADARKVPH